MKGNRLGVSASLAFTPGFPGIAQNLQQRFVLVFISGQDGLRLGHEEDIAFGRQPLQVGETFLHRVPVVAEVVGEIQRPGKFREQAVRGRALLAVDDAQGKSGWSFDQCGGSCPSWNGQQRRPGGSGSLEITEQCAWWGHGMADILVKWNKGPIVIAGIVSLAGALLDHEPFRVA